MGENDHLEPAATDQVDQRVWANRLATAAVVGVASLASFAPLILVPGIPLWVILTYIVVAGAVAFWTVDTTRFATYAPNALEWFLAGVRAAFWFALACILGFLVYALLSLAGIVLGWIVRWLGGSSALNAQPLILGLVLILGALATTLASVISAQDTAEQLYPSEENARSPFYSISQRPRRLLIPAVLAVAGLLLVLRLSGGAGTWLSFGIQLWLCIVGFTSFMIAPGGPRSSTPTEHADAERAVKRLLESLSYTVVPHPRIQDEAIDLFMEDVDLLAYNDAHALAVGVATDIGDIGWHVAAGLEFAAVAAEDYLSRVKGLRIRPEPLLVLAGNEGSGTASPSALTEEASIRIVRLQPADIDYILGTEDDLLLRKLAADTLLPAESAKTPLQPSPPGARGGERR